ATAPDVVVGVDGSESSEVALRWAMGDASLRGRSVTAVLAWAPDGIPRPVREQAAADDPGALTDAAADMLERSVTRVGQPAGAGVDVRRVVVQADAATALVDQAAKASTLVVGKRSHGPVQRLLTGSVSDAVLHLAAGPVVIARANGTS